MAGERKLIIILRFSVDKFVASGLMRREYDGIKLHLTLINTLIRKEQGDLGNKDLGQARESFDCRPVLSGWGSLGLVEVKWRRTGEGYYMPSVVVVVGDNNASMCSTREFITSHVSQW